MAFPDVGGAVGLIAEEKVVAGDKVVELVGRDPLVCYEKMSVTKR